MADEYARQQFDTMAATLRQAGLGSLMSVDAQGNPSGWLWNQIQSGVDTQTELELALEQTDEFRDRFGVILEQRKRAAEGAPGSVMTPAEVLVYEDEIRQMMVSAGLPSTFYDEPKDFHKLILSNMSPAEVGTRITEAFDYVKSAPPEVRAKFEEYYGVGNGDAQLAAWALDPERTTRDINKATRTAYAAGIADRYDVQLDRAAADRIAEMDLTENAVQEGMGQVAAMEDVFSEGLGDSGTDLSDQDGVNAVFENDAKATAAIQNRIARRRAVNRSASGGAAVTQEGVVGVGSS